MPASAAGSAQALRMRAAASASPRKSSIIAALRMAAIGVGLAGADDVGRRAVDRFEHRRPGAVGIQVAARREPDAPGYRAAEIGEDVAEEVVGDDHVVALRRLTK